MKTTYEVYYKAYSTWPYQVVQVSTMEDGSSSRFVMASYTTLEEAVKFLGDVSEDARSGFGIKLI